MIAAFAFGLQPAAAQSAPSPQSVDASTNWEEVIVIRGIASNFDGDGETVMTSSSAAMFVDGVFEGTGGRYDANNQHATAVSLETNTSPFGVIQSLNDPRTQGVSAFYKF